MKFDHIIEYNIKSIFLEKSCTKYRTEIIPRPFPNISKLSMSLDQYYKVLYTLFQLFAKLTTIEKD